MAKLITMKRAALLNRNFWILNLILTHQQRVYCLKKRKAAFEEVHAQPLTATMIKSIFELIEIN